MEETVEVYIEYYGHYSKIAGKKREIVYVSSDLKCGIDDIRKFLMDAYSFKDGFMMMKNNINIISLLRSSEPVIILNGDVFKIIPVFSGG